MTLAAVAVKVAVVAPDATDTEAGTESEALVLEITTVRRQFSRPSPCMCSSLQTQALLARRQAT